MTPPVVIITLRSRTDTFASTEFDRDFKYGTADGTLLVLGSVEPAQKTTLRGLILAWPKVTDKVYFRRKKQNTTINTTKDLPIDSTNFFALPESADSCLSDSML